MLTIDQQIDGMAADFPGWVVERKGERTAVWTGTLQPSRTFYQVRMEYTVPPVIEMHSILMMQPLVEVLYPSLQKMDGNPEGALPHVYWRHPRTDRQGPFLCLFDAEARGWTSSDHLSKTTVPWTAFWLKYYEAWLVTGKWLGAGRHAKKESANGRNLVKRRSITIGPISYTALLGNTF